VDSKRVQRQLEHLTLILQKSGRALAAYLAEPASVNGKPELLLLIADEHLAGLPDHLAQAVKPHIELDPGPEPGTYRLPGAWLRLFPASALAQFTANAMARRGRVLFDHPGAFTRRHL